MKIKETSNGMKKWPFLITLLVALLWTGLAGAQSLPEIGGSSLGMQISPAAPGPNSKVQAKITNYLVSLQTSNVRWLINGKTVLQGSGLTELSAQTGAPGSVLTISAVVTTADGQTLTASRTLRPVLLDLLWQADSSVPPLYRGKALPSTKNLVRFVAIPHFTKDGQNIDPSKLVYQWSVEFDPVPSGSGLGKNTFVTPIVDLIGETRVAVTVSTIDSSISASKNIAVAPENAQISVVRLDELAGPDLDHPIISNYDLSGAEVTVRAQTYYFPRSHILKPGLQYHFAVNGKPAVTTEAHPELLTLRREGEQSGKAQVTVSANDPFDSFISAAKSLGLNFGFAAFK